MGIEQYVYARLGYPDITITGEVASQLKKGEQIGWINQNQAVCSKPVVTVLSKTDTIKKKMFIYGGGCTVRPIHAFMENRVNIRYFKDNSLFLHPICNIALINHLSEQKKNYLYNNVPEIYPEMLSRDVFMEDQYLFLSFWNEFNFYKHTDKSEMDFYFYSKRIESREKIINEFNESKLDSFDIKTAIDSICNSLPSSSRLVVMNFPVWTDNQNHKKANEVIDDMVQKHPGRMLLLDIRPIYSSEKQSDDGGLNHYNRKTGYLIAERLLEILTRQLNNKYHLF